MKTIMEEVSDELIKEAGRIIKNGGLVAFPTETVYGLGANALDKTAAMKIYAAKGRPSDNPLIVHIADMSTLYEIAENVPLKAERLAEKFWPGPLTMIFNKKDCVPYETTGGLDTVAVRMPDNETALKLIRESGGFIAAPSANTSGRPSPTTAEHVFEDMNGKIEAIIDGGAVGIGIESTIVDMSTEVPAILRPGYITQDMLREILEIVEVDPAIIKPSETGARPKAPGMKYKHYAPKADMIIVEGTDACVVKKINELVKEKNLLGKKCGIIASSENVEKYKCAVIKNIGAHDDEKLIAHNLYRVFRDFDDEGVDCIYSEAFRTPNLGMAIMNRLLKAAGYNIIEV